MAFVHVQCPDGHRTDVGQYGQHAHGSQRSRGNHRDGPRTLCLLPSQDKGRLPAVQQPRVAMPLHGRGGREIVRVLRVRAAMGIDVRKQNAPVVTPVHARRLHTLEPEPVAIVLRQGEPAEREERGSCVGSQRPQRGWGPARDHDTGPRVASVLGTREEETCLPRQAW